MSGQELAKALRVRLAEKFIRENRDGRMPDNRDTFLSNLKDTSDENVIAGYLRCAVCGQVSVSPEDAIRMGEDCRTADEWIERLLAREKLLGRCSHDTARPN